MTTKKVKAIGGLAAAVTIFYAGEINQLRMNIHSIKDGAKTTMIEEGKTDHSGIGYSVEELMIESPLATGLLQKLGIAPSYREVRKDYMK